jgi:hypothetical protein
VESPDHKADTKDNRSGGGISVQTLIIAGLASAAASYAASRIWGPGTLISAAATPVIVALVSEFLRRPVETVAKTAKKVPTVQTLPAVRKRTIAAPGDSTRVQEDPTDATIGPAPRAEPHSPSGQPHPRRVEPPAALTPVGDPAMKHSEFNTWRPRWRPAVATGLVAFAIVLALYTVPDLLAGRSITGNGQPTTFFGGSANVKKKANPTTTVTTTPVTTVTKTAPATATTTTTTTQPTTTTGATPTTSATTSTGTLTTTTSSTTTPTASTTPVP